MAQFEDSTTLPHSVYEIVDRHPGASVYMWTPFFLQFTHSDNDSDHL